jgi:hypothetical protein
LLRTSLTSCSVRHTIVIMRSWYRGVLAAFVLMAFCGSTWATCAQGALASQTEQMACCKNGHPDCGPKGTAADCCQKQGPQLQPQATVVKAVPIKAPVRTILAWVTVPTLAFGPQVQPRVSYDASPPDFRVRPPAYILFSTLLI